MRLLLECGFSVGCPPWVLKLNLPGVPAPVRTREIGGPGLSLLVTCLLQLGLPGVSAPVRTREIGDPGLSLLDLALHFLLGSALHYLWGSALHVLLGSVLHFLLGSMLHFLLGSPLHPCSWAWRCTCLLGLPGVLAPVRTREIGYPGLSLLATWHCTSFWEVQGSLQGGSGSTSGRVWVIGDFSATCLLSLGFLLQ